VCYGIQAHGGREAGREDHLRPAEVEEGKQAGKIIFDLQKTEVKRAPRAGFTGVEGLGDRTPQAVRSR
jgi:hypothetical protein